MGKQMSSFTVEVRGIPFSAFSRVKWRQFLREFSLAAAVVIVVLLVLALRNQTAARMPVTALVVIVLGVAVILAVYRTAVRRAYRQAGLENLLLIYTFDKDAWTVRLGEDRVRVLWTKTWKVRRDKAALMLYPNKKSVNLVPMGCLTESQVQQVFAWCGAKRGK